MRESAFSRYEQFETSPQDDYAIIATCSLITANYSIDDTADKAAKQLTSLPHHIQTDDTNEVSEYLPWHVGSWQHWATPVPADSKPDRPYQPTTQSTSDCKISHQITPCTAERPPTKHQERTPRKVCLLPRQ